MNKLSILAVILLFVIVLPSYATQYWTPEQVIANRTLQHPNTDALLPVIAPPIHPPEIYPYFYYSRYMLTVNWLRPLQVTTTGADFGGQREGEGNYYNIIQTDNTQEAIVVWSNARILTGNDTLFRTELPRAWIYCRNWPAWNEDLGNNQYYRSHNCYWGITAAMVYITATHDSTVIGYGDSCANYIRDYPCVGSYSVNAEGMAIGALAQWARWRRTTATTHWLDTALARGQHLRTMVEANPTVLLNNGGAGWALSGGCVFWGILNSIGRQDTAFGRTWANQYSQYLGVRGGTGLWANAFSTWYGNAWSSAFDLTHRQAYRDTMRVIADYLIAQDADNDGGIPATVGEASTQDQSWVSMYLDWMLLFPMVNNTNDLAISVSLIPGGVVVRNDSVRLQVTVSNMGGRSLTYGIHAEATGTSTALNRNWNDSLLNAGETRNYLFSLGTANTDTIFAFARFLAHDENAANDSSALRVVVRPSIQLSGNILNSSGVGLYAVLTFQSLDDSTRVATLITDRSGGYSLPVAAGRYVVQIEPAVPSVRPTPDTITVSLTANHYNKTIPDAFIWVLADDSTSNYSTFIVPSVASTGATYRFDRVESMTNLSAKIPLFRSILWYTGNRVVPFDTGRLAAIRAGLQAGTNIVLTGQNVAERLNVIDTVLLHRFGVSLNSGHIINYHIVGLTGTPWAAVNTYITGGLGAGNQTSQDALDATANGVAWSDYNGFPGTHAAVATGDEFTVKTLLLGFGLEAINGVGVSSRDAVTQLIITWLQTTAAKEPQNIAALPDHIVLSTYPNPFNHELRVNVSLPTSGEVTISVYNTLGQQVAMTKRFTAGTLSWQWNAGELSSGIYWIEAKSRNRNAIQKVVYVR